MQITRKTIEIPAQSGLRGLSTNVAGFKGSAIPIRFAVSTSNDRIWQCEVGLLSTHPVEEAPPATSIFSFFRRAAENAQQFNVVLLVPTGIGAEIGGHAGDAGPVARLFGGCCDTLITHPNVVNASDINEIPENGMYVEGSVICRLLMGAVGLQCVRANRVLAVISAHGDKSFVSAAVNSVNAARAAYGLNCPEIVLLDPPVKLKACYATSGVAVGEVEGFGGLCRILMERRGQFDAVALSSVIEVPPRYHMTYFRSEGKMVNPWGGVEAMLTHAVSNLFEVPSAHSPMFESSEIANMDAGIVDPRMAAEAVSVTFLNCVLKGLQRSPRITERESGAQPGMLSVEDVSCLVIPNGCLGLPTLAALEQGIPVVAVRENCNVMRNDLTLLPWAPGQLTIVENYWEAVGFVTALRAGIVPAVVRRPLQTVQCTV